MMLLSFMTPESNATQFIVFFGILLCMFGSRKTVNALLWADPLLEGKVICKGFTAKMYQYQQPTEQCIISSYLSQIKRLHVTLSPMTDDERNNTKSMFMLNVIWILNALVF